MEESHRKHTQLTDVPRSMFWTGTEGATIAIGFIASFKILNEY